MWSQNIPEVEGKILDIDFESVSQKIRELWGKQIFDGILKAQWFQNTNWEKLRVKQEWEKVVVEHKRKIEGTEWVKSYQETGFEAKDFQSVVDTLLAVWMTSAGLPSVKRRISFLLENLENTYNNVRFDFDEYSELDGKWGIPMLLEIESSTKENVLDAAIKLGIDPKKVISYGPPELITHYHR